MLNPLFVRWVADHFTGLAAKDEKLATLARQAYNKHRHIARAFVHANTYLTRYTELAKEVDDYKKAFESDAYGMVRYLADFTPDDAQGYEDEIEENWDESASAGYEEYNRFRFSVGFWIRRVMDGSYEDIRKVMDTAMREYDGEWYLAHLKANAK